MQPPEIDPAVLMEARVRVLQSALDGAHTEIARLSILLAQTSNALAAAVGGADDDRG